MSSAEDHLVRTGSNGSGVLDLSTPTGLSRLQLEIHRLVAGECLQFDAAAERFLYVLAGSGQLQSTADVITVEPGDFIALTAGESVEVSSELGFSFLFGQSGN